MPIGDLKKCKRCSIYDNNCTECRNNLILDFKPRDYQIEAYNVIKDDNKSLLSIIQSTP